MPVRRKRLFRVIHRWQIRSFQNFRDFHKIRMMDDVCQSVKADLTLPNIGMSVLFGSLWIFAVVDVKDSDLVFSKNPVKLLYDTVKVVSYRVTAVMGMTSKQTRSLSLQVTPS